MSNRQDRPLAKKLLHALGLLALALFLLYVAVQFVLIFHRSYKTETAIRYTLAESLNLTGVVAFDAVDVPGSGKAALFVFLLRGADGLRVAAEKMIYDLSVLHRALPFLCVSVRPS